MPGKGAFIDANLLVLPVVGSIDRRLVSRHRRTRRFAPEDYDILLDFVGGLDRVFVTPDILTEASNLLLDRSDARFMEHLRILIEESEEITVASRVAAKSGSFVRFGLSDVVLLEAVSAEAPLVTVDFDLYGAASAKGAGAAVNFTHYSAAGAPGGM